jgi:hypothetical protein
MGTIYHGAAFDRNEKESPAVPHIFGDPARNKVDIQTAPFPERSDLFFFFRFRG